jgi:hypothetical protein
MAMDRGGGPVLGGGVMDTANGSGVIGVDGGFPDQGSFVHGQMYAKLDSTSLNGFAPRAGTLAAGGFEGFDWEHDADVHYVTDFAYSYFGVSNTFFDLTNAANLNFFVTAGLAPVDFGPAGENITPLNSRFMHTGDAETITGLVPNQWDSTVSYQAADYVTTQDGGQTRYWLALPFGEGPLKLGRPFPLRGPNLDKPPEQFGIALDAPDNGGVFYWQEVPASKQGPEFCWNAANGVLARRSGLISTIAGP